ncbi:MAG: amino acid adenylation domain-containing protein, partial [Nitrosomonas sp.]|nr:amino acid adenylation domain-containing protein [Nitrosomonas sp.]
MNAPDTKFPIGTAEQRQKEELVRRFVHLPPDKRRHFLIRLSEQGIDFSLLPVPAGLAETGDVPLSYAQQRLWFLFRLDPSSTAYHMTSGLRVRGELNTQAVRAAFARIQARHTALRTTFHEIDGQAVQRVHDSQALPYREFDFSGDQHLQDAEIRHLAEVEARTPFDLERGPLWRITLVRLADSAYEIWLSLHHIIADGWSLNCLMHEFSRFYQAEQDILSHDIPAPAITYADYAIWQRAWLEAGEADRQLAFWRSHLAGEQPLLRLPEDYPRPVTPSNRGGRVSFSCDQQLTARLKELARQHGTTLPNVLLSAFFIVLYRYSGQHDLRIGIPLANRDRSEVEAVIGFFVNTVVVRLSIQGQLPVHELLQVVRAAMIDAQAHPDLPFEQLVDALGVERDLDRNPLFQAMYNHQQRAYDALNIPGLEISPVDRDAGGAQVDLSLDTEESGMDAGLKGVFTYAVDLFDAATIEQLCGHYQQVLHGLIESGEEKFGKKRIEQLALDRPHRVAGYPAAGAAGSIFEPVHALFTRRAQMQPEHPAIVYGEEETSYRELDAMSSRLAQRLPLKDGMLAGIMLERSPKMIVAMLAVLKAGGAFLPLDPEDPPERRAAILHTAGIGLLITAHGLYCDLTVLPDAGIVDIDQVLHRNQPAETSGSINAIHPQQLAYVIYTSGSTGQPKGVAVEHGALSMHCQAITKHYALTADDRFLHFAPFQVDAAVEQWVSPLLSGATLVLKSAELWDGDRLIDEIAANAVTRIDLPPGYTAIIAECAEKRQHGLQLRACTVGGEALSREVLASILKVMRPEAVFNAYGPTEAVITPLLWKTTHMPDRLSHYAPIGQVVGDRSAYILDGDLNEAPAGASGELYLGGALLARGYYGQARLTAERFIPDPYSRAGGRLYRTGDLCRLRTDGQLEFLGRIDDQ